MKNLLKKFAYIGIGAASITRKKAQKAVKVLTKEGAISAKQGKKLLTKMVKEADKERKRLERVLIAEAKKEIRRQKRKR
jgi:polyhydroxyalkanoate synthesis regulator phasin